MGETFEVLRSASFSFFENAGEFRVILEILADYTSTDSTKIQAVVESTQLFAESNVNVELIT